MTERTDEEFITAAEACALLDVKPATLYAYVSRGLVKSYKQGTRRQRLYRRSELSVLRGLDGEPSTVQSDELPDAASWVGER